MKRGCPPSAVAKELAVAGHAQEQVAEIRGVAEDVIRGLADTLLDAVGEADATDLLSQWDGFGRFCRACLGMEPLTVTRAFGLGQDDPAAELAALPDAKFDEAEAARWAAEWARGWERRFG